MISLSKRLEEIAMACGECDILIDIGCDHAMIPVSLLERKKIGFAIASDINRGPIESARRNAENANVADRMRFMVSDGLKGLDPKDPVFKDKKTVLLISGMGGPLIEKIIREGRAFLPHIERYVFSPHSKIEEFRRFAGENGFSIDREILTREDGKYYFIISCSAGDDKCREEIDYEIGPGFFGEKSDCKKDYLLKQLGIYKDLCSNEAVTGPGRRKLEGKLQLYEKAVKLYDMC